MVMIDMYIYLIYFIQAKSNARERLFTNLPPFPFLFRLWAW